MGYDNGVIDYDSFYDRCSWQLSFSWLPRRCSISNKLIWLKYAYRGIRVITGPGEAIVDVRWHDGVEHMLWQLKRG